MADSSCFFSDGLHNRTASVTFPLGSTDAGSTTLEVRNLFWYVSSVIPIPWGTEGTFRLSLPEGDYRVAPAGTPAIPGFYIRALSYGDMDLSRERMKLRSDSIDEFVIFLAACRDAPESACD